MEIFLNIFRLNYSPALPHTKTHKPNGKKKKKSWERIPQPVLSHNVWGFKVKNQSIDE